MINWNPASKLCWKARTLWSYKKSRLNGGSFAMYGFLLYDLSLGGVFLYALDTIGAALLGLIALADGDDFTVGGLEVKLEAGIGFLCLNHCCQNAQIFGSFPNQYKNRTKIDRILFTLFVNGYGLTFPKTKRKPLKTQGFQGFGAAGRIRTADLILTKDALYLLSYSSINGDPERARTVDL